MGQNAHVAGSGNLVVQIGRDLVVGDRPTLDLVLERPVGTGLLASLNPYGRAIDPVGRDAEMAALWQWLERADRPFGVRVLTGQAGTGKTRLLIELCHEAVAKHWQAGFAAKDEIAWFVDHHRTVDWVWEKRTLIVVDYAAQQPEPLRKLVAGLASGAEVAGRPPIRLLLLERFAETGSGWWQQVFPRATFTERSRDFLDPAEPVELPGLDDRETRRRIFSAALHRAAPTREAPQTGSDPRFDRQLAEISWGGRPLFLAMAGLLAAERGVHGVLALNRTDLALAVAGRELENIRKLAEGSHRVQPELLIHMVAFVTLCSGVPVAEVEGIVDQEKTALRRSGAGDPPDVVTLLRQALPIERKRMSGGGGTEIEVLQPILPDVIGEAVLLRRFEDAADKGSAAVLRAFLQSPFGAVSRVLHTGQDFGSQQLAPVWGAWIRALLDGPATDPDVLLFIDDQWPRFSTALAELAAEVAEKVVDVWRQRQSSDPGAAIRLANSLNTLGVRLGDTGRRAKALASAEEAVELLRRLDAANPNVFEANLAGSLNTLANRLSDVGLRAEALASAAEAVGLNRRTVGANPDAHEPELVIALSTLANGLSAVGRQEEALASAEEAVDLCRRLAEASPDAYLPFLAASLNNFAIRLSEVGRWGDALEPGEEAVGLFRRLAGQNPGAYERDLALSLTNLANRLSQLGRQSEALGPAEEAVGLYRRLVGLSPDAYKHYLAMSLTNLANNLSTVGRLAEALALAEEAVDLLWPLARVSPDPYEPYLAISLNNLAIRLSDLGRWTEALAPAREAVEIRRRLARANRQACEPELASSLNNLSFVLSGLGLNAEALATADEAVAIYRRFATGRPNVHEIDLAISLNSLANMLSKVGQRANALMRLEEAMSLLMSYFVAMPVALAPRMARIAKDYMELCDALPNEVDLKLLGPLVAVFQSLNSDRAAFNPEGDSPS